MYGGTFTNEGERYPCKTATGCNILTHRNWRRCRLRLGKKRGRRSAKIIADWKLVTISTQSDMCHQAPSIRCADFDTLYWHIIRYVLRYIAILILCLKPNITVLLSKKSLHIWLISNSCWCVLACTSHRLSSIGLCLQSYWNFHLLVTLFSFLLFNFFFFLKIFKDFSRVPSQNDKTIVIYASSFSKKILGIG